MAGERDIKLLEGALARTLTTTEKTAVSTAAAKRDAALKTIVRDFENEVAAIFGMTASQLQSKINICRSKGRADLATVLAEALGRALTDEEKSQLNAMIAARDAAIKEVLATFHESVAAALGLSPAELGDKIRAFQESQRGRP